MSIRMMIIAFGSGTNDCAHYLAKWKGYEINENVG